MIRSNAEKIPHLPVRVPENVIDAFRHGFGKAVLKSIPNKKVGDVKPY